MAASSKSSTELEARLGHSFADKELLRLALTHASHGVQSNERLEFLGDRVLGLVIANKLFALFPEDAEGALAVKYNALVRSEACVRAAEGAGLADHLILGASEANSGGRQKAALLAGACEAIIAALYLDGGYEPARQFIEKYWSATIDTLEDDMRDPKTALQEWAQGPDVQSRGQPVYRLAGREGPDHAPRFSVSVTVAKNEPETGHGGSKREAEQDAAKKMLTRLGLWKDQT